MCIFPKPRFRDSFRRDLIKNFVGRSDGKTIRVYKYDLVIECVMYSCDMCLEFQRKSEGLLTKDWVEHITTEVGEALKTIFPDVFNDSDIIRAIDKVHKLLVVPERYLQVQIDQYYNRI